MLYDKEVTLIKYVYDSKDDLGQEIPTPIKTTILCAEKSIGYREFFAAASAGIRTDITLLIHRFEYDGQTTVQFENKMMKVIRIFSISSEEMELTCSEIVGLLGD